MTGARAVWTEGSQWRVIREGARLSGMVSGGPGWMRGWGRPLVDWSNGPTTRLPRLSPAQAERLAHELIIAAARVRAVRQETARD
jgi:hypothetical protein